MPGHRGHCITIRRKKLAETYRDFAGPNGETMMQIHEEEMIFDLGLAEQSDEQILDTTYKRINQDINALKKLLSVFESSNHLQDTHYFIPETASARQKHNDKKYQLLCALRTRLAVYKYRALWLNVIDRTWVNGLEETDQKEYKEIKQKVIDQLQKIRKEG